MQNSGAHVSALLGKLLLLQAESKRTQKNAPLLLGWLTWRVIMEWLCSGSALTAGTGRGEITTQIKKKNNQNILHVGCDSRHLNRIRKKQRSPLCEESPRAGHEPGRGGGSGRNAAAEFPAFHGNSAKAGATWAVGRSVLKILLGNGNVWEAPPVCGTGDERGRAGFWRLGGFVWRVLSVAFMGNLPWVFQNVVGLFKAVPPSPEIPKNPKLTEMCIFPWRKH